MLVPKPPNLNMVRSMWLFRHKYHVDGSLSRYKARLVANGRTQQAPRAWFQRFASYALRIGFSYSRCDSSLFIYRHGSEELEMTDLGALNYFLGISVTRDSTESKIGPDRDLVSDPILHNNQTANHVQHQWMKHIEIDIHFVRDMVTKGQNSVTSLSVLASSLGQLCGSVDDDN
ncbi:ribonuclease H-like domain-containing protein [Tanacetum coccineum]